MKKNLSAKEKSTNNYKKAETALNKAQHKVDSINQLRINTPKKLEKYEEAKKQLKKAKVKESTAWRAYKKHHIMPAQGW